MKKNAVLVVSVALLLSMVLVNTLVAEHEHKGTPSNAEVMQKTQKLQMPFIANEGQLDERVAFYARTFGGTVFVTKDGEIVYSLPAGREEGRQGSSGAEEQGRNAVSGWHGQALLVRAASEFTANGYVPIFRADKASCPPDRVLAKSLLAAYLPGLQKGTDKQSLSMPPNSNPGVLPANYNANIKPVIQAGLLPEPLSLLNTGVCAVDTISKGLNNGVQVANLNPQGGNGAYNATPTTPTKTVALKEEFIGAKVFKIKGEGESVTKVSYFKGNDPSKSKSNIFTYELLNLGEIYDGGRTEIKGARE